MKANSGRIFKFSSKHVSGVQLDQYTGVAAILRFPLPEMQDWENLCVSNPLCEVNSLTASTSVNNESNGGKGVARDDEVGGGQPAVDDEEYDEFDDYKNNLRK